MAVSDGDDVTVVKDQGLVASVFDDRTLAGLDGHLAIGPLPLLHHRLVHLAQRPAGLPGRGDPALRPRPQRQPHQHRGAGRRRPGCCPAPSPATPTSSRSSSATSWPRLPDGVERRARPRTGSRHRPALAWRAPSRSCVMDESRVIGVRDPNGFRPLCLGKLDHGWVLASESPALDIVGAHFVRELDPGEMVVIDATGPRSLRPFPDERVDPRSVPLRVRVLRPPRHPALQAERPPGPHPHRRAAGRAGAGRGRHGDGRARVGRSRRRGVRPPERHPLRPRRGEEPLHRPQLHRPQPGAAGAGGADEAEPAARRTWRASGSSSSTTRSSAAPRRSSSPGCSARPGPPRCTCASPHRP